MSACVQKLKIIYMVPVCLVSIFQACMNPPLLEDSWKDFEVVIGDSRKKPYSAITKNHAIEENSNVDLVFVVDSSGSMIEEHKNLADNFSVFVNNLDSDFDILMALVTSDGYAMNDDDAGNFDSWSRFCNLPGTEVQSVSYGLFSASNLLNATGYLDPDNYDKYIGTGGCHNERPLYYGYNMFINNSNFRENTHRVMIVLTDEDERSECKYF